MNNNFTISIFFASSKGGGEFLFGRKNFLINNYDNNRSIINFCLNLYFITFAWQFPLATFTLKCDPLFYWQCETISQTDASQKLCNFNNKNLPFDKKNAFHPSRTFSEVASPNTFPFRNDLNGYKLFIIKWFVVVKTYCDVRSWTFRFKRKSNIKKLCKSVFE